MPKSKDEDKKSAVKEPESAPMNGGLTSEQAMILKCMIPLDKRLIEKKYGGKDREGNEIYLDYYPQYAVIDRLNEVFGRWDFTCTDPEIVVRTEMVWSGKEKKMVEQDTYAFYVIGTLHTPIGTRSAVGVGTLQGALANNADAMLKGASTDAMKKCASMFGIGAELYPGSSVHNSVKWFGADDNPELSNSQKMFIKNILIKLGAEDDKDVNKLLSKHANLDDKGGINALNYVRVVEALINAADGESRE